MKKTRRITLLALIAVLALAVTAMAACKDTSAKITFDGNGATGGTAPQAIDTTIGATVTLPQCNLTKTGHTFDGWKTGDKTYKAGDTFEVTAAETTFVAQWKAEQPVEPTTYALTYAAGDHGTGTAPAAVQKEAGDKFNLEAATLFSAETGYEFDGWSDGTTKYAAGAEFTMPEKAVTMTAMWKKVPVLEEFLGECVLPAVNNDQSAIPSVPSVTVVGLKIDFANKKAYYKLTDSTDWVDGKYFNNSSTSIHKPDNYGSDALYIEIKIETIAYYALIKQDMTMLYLCNSDDRPLENGEFENINAERTVTYIKPEGVTGTTPEVQTVQRGTKVTLASADTFVKEGWTFYKWQVSTYGVLRAPATQIDVNANTTVKPVFSKEFSGAEGKILLLDDGTVIKDGYTYECTINGKIVAIDTGYYILTIEVNETSKTYVILDGMHAYLATENDGTTKLSFNGKGGAMLGETAGTYELLSYTSLKLSIGGQVYTLAIDTNKMDLGLKARITIDGTTYVFGEEATVTFELGTGVDGTAPESQTVFKGEQITLPDGTGLTNGDKTFAGWTVKGGAETVLTGKYTVNGNVTLVSAWKDSTGGDPVTPSHSKLIDFAGSSSSTPVSYGYTSLENAGNDFIQISTMSIFKIDFYWSDGYTKGFIVKRYYGTNSSNTSQMKDESYENTLADKEMSNATIATKLSGLTVKFTFGLDSNNARTVTIQVETANGSGVFSEGITWTEITA